MTTATWNTALDQAFTDHAVINICDRFAATLTFEELGRIPSACQPHAVVAASDVAPYAAKLAARLVEDEGAATPLLQRMSTFFTHAALRVAHIAQAQPQAVDLAGEPHSRYDFASMRRKDSF